MTAGKFFLLPQTDAIPFEGRGINAKFFFEQGRKKFWIKIKTTSPVNQYLLEIFLGQIFTVESVGELKPEENCLREDFKEG